MAFGIKFTPLTPAAQLPSRRDSLADVTNASMHFPTEEVTKAIHYLATMNDFFRNYSQNLTDGDHSLSPAEGPLPQINFANEEKMVVDSQIEPPPEEYDVFPDLAFLESINPQHFDFPFSMEDPSSIPESNEYDIGLARMAELRALLLETFPDGMPKEIDYESILADQHVPSDPLDPSFWNYFQGSVQTESTPDEQ
ncbi:hypothetical protein BYT27DRAFT_7194705 [Phlegmacium glaucopus]|nr:hypothetical protein BYT27DRAFT_7194705 [Phlegmacium glaucopus]